jgi:predicted enzyme related to lactoylglutathione lyase
MAMTMEMVTIDCPEPRRLATFWAAALDPTVAADYDGEYLILAGKDGRPMVGLQKVPEGKSGKNRVHLDFSTDDRAAEVSRLLGLGATQIAEHSMPGLGWTVLTDPEGNEFCVGEGQ